jgi:hypothetical protein
MGIDKFLDSTVWAVGRGAKKVKGAVDDVKSIPGKAKDKVVAKVTPTCRRNGGSLSCTSGDPKKKKGRGVTCKHCGNGIL